MYTKSERSADLDKVIVADHSQFSDAITGFKKAYEALKIKFKKFETELY
jgi:hypothetical protein